MSLNTVNVMKNKSSCVLAIEVNKSHKDLFFEKPFLRCSVLWLCKENTYS